MPSVGAAQRLPRVIPGGSLSQRAATGFLWMSAQTVGSKLVSMGGQVVLAWLLEPKDFGLVGMAYMISAFAGLIQQAGLDKILVQRQKHFGRWATPAFWMSLALGLLSGLAMVMAAPAAERIYKRPELVGLICVLALAAPLGSLSIVPTAKLQIQLRFRTLASLALVLAVATTGLSVLFAWCGWGAYSFVCPLPLVNLGRAASMWWLARPRVKPRLQLRRWRFLVGDSGSIVLAAVFYTILSQADYGILGLFRSSDEVGLYFWAFNLSLQTALLFGLNIASVLFPALSHIRDNPVQQTQAFLRASRLLALVAIPACLLQAAVGDALIRAVFKPDYHAAIPVFQVLSLCTAIRVVGSPGGSLLQAQGRFRAYLTLAVGYATGFVVFVAAGAYLGGGLYVGIAEAIYFSVIDPVNLYVAIRGGGGTVRDVWRIYAAPLLVGGAAMGLAVFVGHLVPASTRPELFGRVAVITVVGGVSYLAVIRRVAAPVWGDLVERLRGLWPA